MSYIVITGASSGIGRAAALAFARRGRDLILTARRVERLETLRAEILRDQPGLQVILMPADLSEPENVHRLYARAAAYPLDTWVNNAGFGHYGPVGAQDLGKIRRMVRLNVEAPMLLSTLFARDYRDAPGAQLINVASCGGYVLVPDAVSYCASKFYLTAFTEGLDRELRAAGASLRAKVLAPAATKTEFGPVAAGEPDYDYDRHFPTYYTAEQTAACLLALWDSDCPVGLVDRRTFQFTLRDYCHPAVS